MEKKLNESIRRKIVRLSAWRAHERMLRLMDRAYANGLDHLAQTYCDAAVAYYDIATARERD